jgi:hypothetical protein
MATLLGFFWWVVNELNIERLIAYAIAFHRGGANSIPIFKRLKSSLQVEL